jgi:hypothetical protein
LSGVEIEEQVISNCYRISPTGRLRIEAVVPTSVFEHFQNSLAFLPHQLQYQQLQIQLVPQEASVLEEVQLLKQQQVVPIVTS